MKAFQVFDRDQIGYIDVQEIKDIMMQDSEKLSEEEIKEILATVDLDANGKVEYEGMWKSISKNGTRSVS